MVPWRHFCMGAWARHPLRAARNAGRQAHAVMTPWREGGMASWDGDSMDAWLEGGMRAW